MNAMPTTESKALRKLFTVVGLKVPTTFAAKYQVCTKLDTFFKKEHFFPSYFCYFAGSTAGSFKE